MEKMPMTLLIASMPPTPHPPKSQSLTTPSTSTPTSSSRSLVQRTPWPTPHHSAGREQDLQNVQNRHENLQPRQRPHQHGPHQRVCHLQSLVCIRACLHPAERPEPILHLLNNVAQHHQQVHKEIIHGLPQRAISAHWTRMASAWGSKYGV